jgi:hypothetical protein
MPYVTRMNVRPSRRTVRPLWRRSALASVFVLVVAALGACAYRGGDISDPVVRKLSWFSYVAARDLRDACVPGAVERYRFVYNGRYLEQVRTYDLAVLPDGSGVLDVQVAGQPDMLEIRDLDLLGPARGVVGQARLEPAEMAQLRRDLADSGFDGPAPAGRRLDSESFYWLAAACRDGAFRFNAWEWPSPRFDSLRFPERLFIHDPTGVPVNPPREPDEPPMSSEDQRMAVQFVLTVTENGLVESAAPF